METAQTANPPSYESVWAILQEVAESQKEDREQMKEDREQMRALRESQKESQKEAERLFKESQKEAAERQREAAQQMKELREIQKRTSEQLGGLHNSMGDLIETLFAPHLGEKFDAYNYNLRRVYRRVAVYDDNNRLRTDIDLLLSNTTVSMAVEVKRWLQEKKHVDHHLERMQLIKQYPPAEIKGKKLLGAIVGAVVSQEAREYAEQNGLFVLELAGEDVRLLEPPEGFQPKEW